MKKSCFLILFSTIFLSAQALADSETNTEVGASLHSKESIAIDQIPLGILIKIAEHSPKFSPKEAEKEIKHGNTYIDVEGVNENGEEIEFDMLLEEDGSWVIAEIQGDLTLRQVPKPVQDIFKQTVDAEPLRIIESDQGDGTTIYEFYTEEGGKEIKTEVKLSVELLTKEWQH